MAISIIKKDAVIVGARQINYNNSTTILTTNVIPSTGMYFIILMTQNSNLNVGSLYFVRYYNNNYYVTPVFEGTDAQAPRITSSGVLKLNGSGTNMNVRNITLKIH